MSRIGALSTEEQLLVNCGWQLPGDGGPQAQQDLHDHFVAGLSFGKPPGKLVEAPSPSIGVDFCKVEVGDEFWLRKQVFLALKRSCPEEHFFFLDVNHQYWEFVPSDLNFTRGMEPFPCGITPWADTICLSAYDFSTGLVSNWSNRHMIVYGEILVEAFEKDPTLSRRIVDVSIAEEEESSDL